MSTASDNHRLWVTLTSLVVALGTIWVCGQWFSDSRIALSLYERRYKFNTGHRLAEQMSLAAADESHACLIIGPSTAREGFDPDVLGDTVPGIKFFNGGGTGGTYQVQESQAAMMRRYDLHPFCVIVAINPWIMIAEPHGLDWDGLLGLLTKTDIDEFALKPMEDPANVNLRQQAWLNTILPHSRHAWQINRMMREAIYRVHVAIFGSKALSIKDFSRDKDDLVKTPRFSEDATRFTEEQFSALHKAMAPRYFDKDNYGDPKLDQPLINALDTLRTLTPRLFVVRTPESERLDIPNSYVAPYLERLISRFPPDVVYIDMSKVLNENQLHDFVHPLPDGRTIFSQEYGRHLAQHLFKEPR
jgi:hypothetical protein